MDTWHCKRCDTSVGEDELECPVCNGPHPMYGRLSRSAKRAANPSARRKSPSTETLQDLANFAKQGKFTSKS